MKTRITLLVAAVVAGAGQLSSLAHDCDDCAKSRTQQHVVVGGRNSPQYIAIAPAKKDSQLAAQTKAPARPEIMVGGRNAPNQIRAVSEPVFQVAPAAKK